MKKCPICNSTKYGFVNKTYRCAKCGYTHKSTEVINKELKK